MADREDALKALENRDWIKGAEVEHQPRQVMVVHSARFPRELSRRLEDEATRRGTTPSALLRELVEQALTLPAGEPDEPVMVRPSTLRRALDAALRHAA